MATDTHVDLHHVDEGAPGGPAVLLGASLTGRPAPRPDDIRVSHKGFDFRALLARVGERFDVSDVSRCPFPALPWWCNSQVFARLRPRMPAP